MSDTNDPARPEAIDDGRRMFIRAAGAVLGASLVSSSRHGGMDYIEDYRLIKCLREGLPTDMNVYDAAALSAVVHLSGQSVAKRSAAVDFPDFTRGRWKTSPPLGIIRG